ncbi:serine/threonine-protein phosphatase 2A regulatory subunit B'' subunit gamma-like isoform X2 [Planococcus citri]|uniref:serine/threonine-protein phosphatase 2A regulatory subunit B'' subunit gamma-like isoform X2 n=1 Tax=Planococcus citri TaxID=170843 RepID=UPI0031F9C9B8
MNLKEALEKYVQNTKYDAAEYLAKEVNHFKFQCENRSVKLPFQIPRFYFKVPTENDVMQQRLREEARSNFLQRRNKELLKNDELKDLWSLLDEHQIHVNGEEGFLSYENFLRVASLAENKYKKYFSPSIFAKLQQPESYGKVNTTCLFNYIMRKVWLHQTRIGLSIYDNTGEGYLRQEDLENYISELIPTLPQLDGLETSFHKFYICTAVRRFMFFLDPLHTGRIRIQDILACGFLDELIELRDEELSKESQVNNWFSASSALRVYGDYLNLDKDHNGMLSKEELACYGTGSLTKVFIDRVFQECITYDGEIDYKTYLDFVLALENRHEPQSLHYLFRILDINGQGYLDIFCLNYFFKAIQDLLKMNGQELVPFENIQNEIFDMVKPEQPDRITLKDLLHCEQGDTVVSILIDLHGFWSYETREMAAAETTSDISRK